MRTLGEQAAAGGDDHRRRRASELAEQARHRAVVLVVIEHDQALLGEEGAEAREELAAPARGAVADGEHLAQRAVVPGANAKPVDAPFEAAGEAVAKGAGQERLAAPAGPHQGQASGAGRIDGAGERR
jgi:hypothetical protein